MDDHKCSFADEETCLTHDCNAHGHCMKKGCPHCDLEKNQYHMSSIKKAELNPNDIMVVQLDRNVSQYEADNIHRTFKHLFPNNKTIICEKGIELKIVSQDEKLQLTNSYLKAKDFGEIE